MKHNFKRFISSLIAASMLLSLTCFAQASSNLSLTAADTTAVPGGTVEVSVSAAENPGIASLALDVSFDSSVLTLTGCESSVDGTVSNQANALTFTASDPSVGVSANGELFTLSFSVAEDAQAGDYDITLSGSGTAADGSELSPAFSAGTVTIEEPAVEYTVTINKVGLGDAGADKTKYTAGETVTLTADAALNYDFTRWTSDTALSFVNANAAQTTFTMPASDVVITAMFSKKANIEYSITLNQPSAGGTISANVDSACHGDTVAITASPAPGYYFASWLVSGGNADLSAADAAKAYFEMPAENITVSATFNPVPERAYSVTIHSDEGGYPVIAKKYYSPSETVNITSTHDDGYFFDGWSCDSSDVVFSDASLENTNFTMPAHDITIRASYSYDSKTLYRVTLATEGGGIASTSNNVYEYSAGDTVTVSATQASGYRFYGWSPLDSGVTFMNPSSTTTTFIMPAKNITIKAMFIYAMYGGGVAGGGSTSSGTNAGAGMMPGTQTPGTYTVTFNTGGGTMISAQTIAAGGTAVRPSDPTLSGCTFGGWYSDYSYTSAFNFSQPIYANTTVYAKWNSASTSTSGTTSGTSSAFTDVSTGDWFHDYVITLYNRGIINGTGGGKFAPSNNITRAEFVKILAGLSGVDLSGYTTSDFSDVKSGDWFASCVAWAKTTGIAGGSNGKFNPNAPISRQDMAVMIKRYADHMAITLPTSTPASTFADASSISAYAADAVKAMQQAGIIGGKGGNRFDPKANATRAEACKMICVLMQIAG